MAKFFELQYSLSIFKLRIMNESSLKTCKVEKLAHTGEERPTQSKLVLEWVLPSEPVPLQREGWEVAEKKRQRSPQSLKTLKAGQSVSLETST
jgi:hypothetical protein